jgi:tripartite-type tricarboxylate transporter receptor subunit TctC
VTSLPAAANATDVYPTRPIHLIVPYPPGGGTDIVGRLLGEKLGASLKQPIVVDNRGGAGGVLGTEVVAKAAPDGYTLLLVPTSHVINPSIYAKLPYDTVKAFAPITMVASAPILMAVNPRVPATRVHEFVDAAKADPKGIANFGSAGVGTVFHLTGQMFDELSGLTLQHVPYRGGRADRDRAARRRGTACLRDHAIASSSCPRGHAASPRNYQRATQPHDA